MFDILGVSKFHMFYVYDFMCWVWTLKCIIDEMFVLSEKLLSTWVFIVFVLSERLWST